MFEMANEILICALLMIAKISSAVCSENHSILAEEAEDSLNLAMEQPITQKTAHNAEDLTKIYKKQQELLHKQLIEKMNNIDMHQFNVEMMNIVQQHLEKLKNMEPKLRQHSQDDLDLTFRTLLENSAPEQNKLAFLVWLAFPPMAILLIIHIWRKCYRKSIPRRQSSGTVLFQPGQRTIATFQAIGSNYDADVEVRDTSAETGSNHGSAPTNEQMDDNPPSYLAVMSAAPSDGETADTLTGTKVVETPPPEYCTVSTSLYKFP